MSPLRFPQRLITITFTAGDDTEPQLTHPVTLKGIKSDTKLLNIVLTIGKKTYGCITLLTQTGDHHHSATVTTTTAHRASHGKLALIITLECILYR